MKSNEMLKWAREQKGLTQVKLSEIVGCTQACISALESGDRKAGNRKNIKKMCEVLDIDMKQLLHEVINETV